MKRLFSALLSLLLLLSLSACGGKGNDKAPEYVAPDQTQEDPAGDKTPEKVPEVSPALTTTPLQIMKGASYYDEWGDNFNPLCLATWEDIALIDDHPKLAAALYELNTDHSTAACSFMQEWLPDAKEALEQSPAYFNGFTLESKYTIQRADSLILSFREDFSSYTGGVHPNYGTWGYNFDPATGTQLGLTDVLTDTEGLDEILTEKIRAKYTFEPFDSLDEMLMDYGPEDYHWTLGYQGLTFYFSPYEIASYAAGLLTATIWFDEMPELFREEYMAVPEGGYAMALPYWHEIEVDLNTGNDTRDTLSVWAQEDEYGEKHLSLTLNGENYIDETWYALSVTPYLVCVGDSGSERFYLYVEGSGENDYCTMYIYDLNGTGPQLIADYSGVGFLNVWEPEAGIDGIYYSVLFNDPVEFTLGSKCNLLGTKTAYRNYTVDADGTLYPLNDTYTLREDLDPIISSISLPVILLPQNSKEIIPAGTEFRFLRTDNETYVDLAMADGQECRIVIEEIDWTPTINGVPEWECFENLIYAG